MATQYKNLINGEMVENGEWLDVVNPANEEVIGQVPACGKGELDRAVAAAREAFKSWKKTPHAKAFETLGTDEAKKLAAEKGVKGNPQEEDLLRGTPGRLHGDFGCDQGKCGRIVPSADQRTGQAARAGQGRNLRCCRHVCCTIHAETGRCRQ